MEPNRCVLEVLKYLDPKDVLSSASTVSQQWLKLSNSAEIWDQFCESEGFTAEEMEAHANSPKLVYRKYSNLQIYHTVILTQGQLQLFDCKKKRALLTRAIEVSTTCSAVMLRNDRVFFTGGKDEYQLAFLYDFTKDQIEEYPNTFDRRRYHGSVHYHSRVYLFGGDYQGC